LLWLKWLVRPVQTDDPAHSAARLTRWRAESRPRPSEHPEVAVVVEDFPREILVLCTEFPDLLDERRVLVVTAIDAHVFAQPGRKRGKAVRRLRLQIPGDVDQSPALLVPDRGLNSWSHPLVVEVLDGMTASVRPRRQGVLDVVGPHDARFENPPVGEVPAQACAEDAIEHVDRLLFLFCGPH